MVFLLFTVGHERYALESSQIVEVVPLVELIQVPKAPAYLAGVFTYRGTLVPVLDLGQLMHSQPCPTRLSTRIVLVNYPGGDGTRHILGLMAEHVTDTVTKEPTDFAPVGMSVEGAPYLGGILTDEHGMLQRVRVEHLLPTAVRATLFADLED
ncbi:MAG: chemotaxis protein CheW [Candidatus Tectomicrobia bacterium]